MGFSFYPEFSFFLVILIILLGLFLFFVRGLLRLLVKPGLLRKFSLIVVLGLVFFLSKEVGFFLSVLLMIVLLPGSRKPSEELPYALIFGIIFGMFVNYFYFSKIEVIWEALSRTVISFLDVLHIHQGYRFVDVYAIFRFFRNYYPGLLIGITMLEVLRNRWAKEKPITCYYRYTKRFSHVLLVPMMFFVIGLALASFLPETHQVRRYFLNFAILFSLPYLLYGGLTIVYGLRRLGEKTIWVSLLFYSLVIFSGPLFLFILIVIIGIGVSDIWMNYNRRLKHLF